MKLASTLARGLVLPICLLAFGCSSSGGGSTGTGGTSGSGGAIGSGGAGSGGSGSGGAPGSGGALGSGGADAATDLAAEVSVDVPAEVAPVDGGANPTMNMFVTSDTKTNGNLGGLAASDLRCQTLAAAVGAGGKTWKAYLSVETPATNAIDRIAEGPYFNAAGVMVAATKAALHMRDGDAALFLTEKGEKVNGQWTGSPTPNHHDVFTGTLANGMLATGMTCGDWNATTGQGQVGHTDGLGPAGSMAAQYRPWNASHPGSCSNPGPAGGVGKIVCFVAAP